MLGKGYEKRLVWQVVAIVKEQGYKVSEVCTGNAGVGGNFVHIPFFV